MRLPDELGLAPRQVRLKVQVTPLDDFSLEVRWRWERRPGTRRDTTAERALVDAVRVAVPDGVLPAGGRPGDVPSFTGLPAPARLAGMAAVRFARTALPALTALDGVVVDVTGELPHYREARDAPVLTFEALRPADRDWYDLTVSVHVDGEGVPFGTLFTALVKRRNHLVLPSGLYFPLRDGRFAELIAMIEESRGLPEAPEHTLRVSRHDTSAWERIELLGAVEGRARAWRESARAVARAPSLAAHPPPVGVTATCAPTSGRASAGWLPVGERPRRDPRRRHGPGQDAADARAGRPRPRAGAAPFLVVAPTSVVSTWAAGGGAVHPGLDVRVVTESQARRGASIAAVCEGADVVVTSYTLFRLEQADVRRAGRGAGWCSTRRRP